MAWQDDHTYRVVKVGGFLPWTQELVDDGGGPDATSPVFYVRGLTGWRRLWRRWLVEQHERVKVNPFPYPCEWRVTPQGRFWTLTRAEEYSRRLRALADAFPS